MLYQIGQLEAPDSYFINYLVKGKLFYIKGLSVCTILFILPWKIIGPRRSGNIASYILLGYALYNIEEVTKPNLT